MNTEIKKGMKIIFLDIDGVLNSAETCKYYHEKYKAGGFGGFFKPDEECTEKNVLWGKPLVANLQRLVSETGASIVISSTWRKHYEVEKFKEMFSVYGWNDAPVIDRTVRLATYMAICNYCRGDEIEQWIKENSPKSYVILDDDSDMLPHQNFVQTDSAIGLTESDVRRSIELLNL